MKRRMWKCANCKRIKELGTEIARADMGAICKQCQQGLTSTPTPDAAPAQQQTVTVHRRGFQRKHGTDRRDIE